MHNMRDNLLCKGRSMCLVYYSGSLFGMQQLRKMHKVYRWQSFLLKWRWSLCTLWGIQPRMWYLLRKGKVPIMWKPKICTPKWPLRSLQYLHGRMWYLWKLSCLHDLPERLYLYGLSMQKMRVFLRLHLMRWQRMHFLQGKLYSLKSWLHGLQG